MRFKIPIWIFNCFLITKYHNTNLMLHADLQSTGFNVPVQPRNIYKHGKRAKTLKQLYFHMRNRFETVGGNIRFHLQKAMSVKTYVFFFGEIRR